MQMQIYYQFIFKICSVTYVEIFHASSIELYLTFKTLFKKSVVCNFFKILKGPFSFYLDFHTTKFFQICTESEEYCILLKKVKKNMSPG